MVEKKNPDKNESRKKKCKGWETLHCSEAEGQGSEALGRF